MSRIIIKQLPKNINEDTLRNIFGVKGTITDVQLKYAPDGRFRQFGFIGYQSEKEAQEAIKYFNNTCIKSNRIKVELCATLGGEGKPQCWSKYTKDSRKCLGISKDIPKTNIYKEKSSAKNSKVEEIIGKYKSDPEFKEFLEAHSNKRLLWDNDLGKIQEDEEEGSSKESAQETLKEKTNDEDYLETNPEEDDTKLATKPINDMEYMKALMLSKNTSRNELKKKSGHNLFTIKIHNVPYKLKRQDVLKFFKPLKPHSVRLPTNVRGFCYVGFKTEKEMSKAMLRNKSFIKGKQVFFTDFTEKNKISKLKENCAKSEVDLNGNSVNSKWKQQELSLCNEEDIAESGKVFFRNLAYTVTEDDLQALFEQYGPIAELKLPIDSVTRQIKGFGTVTFLMPENAVSAFNKLDGSIFHGRLLHLIPGKSDNKDSVDTDKESTLTFKQKKAIKLKKDSQQPVCWNTLFLGANAVAEIVAKQFETTKEKVLDTKEGGSNAAVRIALGETQAVLEMRKFLEDNGVQLDVFNSVNVKRSKTVILAKNLPPHTEVQDIAPIFKKFGPIARIVLPPNGVTAIIEYCEATEARQAFKKLAYTKFKNVPLYLEWAPENILSKQALEEGSSATSALTKDEALTVDVYNETNRVNETEKEEQENDENEEEESNEVPEPNTTLFLRNLNFDTTVDTVNNHFKHLGAIHSVEIAKRREPNNPSTMTSLGYGFIQFNKESTAEKALKTMQFTMIDNKRVELKRSDRVLRSNENVVPRKTIKLKEQTGTKILVRNIPFQAKVEEVRDIFRAFGELRTVRLPKKLTPGEIEHRGFGFVDFISKSEAKRAFDALCFSTHLYGRRLVLEWASITTDTDLPELRKRMAQNYLNLHKNKHSKRIIFKAEESNTADLSNNNSKESDLIF